MKAELLDKNPGEQVTTLNWQDRPDEVKEAINKIFEPISKKPKSEWARNSDEKYYLAKLDDHEFIKKIIKDTSSQTEFNILEIGSGAFNWIHALEKFLNNDRDIPDNIKFNIIGLNGENCPSTIEEHGKCKIYKFGHFKVEEILQQFEERSMNLVNNVDFIISNFTFRHLVDPVGTFQQVYSLVKPKTGYILTDGLNFIRQNVDGKAIYDSSMLEGINSNFAHLLLDFKAKFLMRHYDDMRSYDHFLIKKEAEDNGTTQLSYTGLDHKPGITNMCAYITKFTDNKACYVKLPENYLEGFNKFMGNGGIFDDLKKDSVFEDPTEKLFYLGEVACFEQPQ